MKIFPITKLASKVVFLGASVQAICAYAINNSAFFITIIFSKSRILSVGLVINQVKLYILCDS
jgi:hypothetical protein